MLTSVRFRGIKVLGDVATDLEPFTVIVGPNGCGKSTLLDQIALLCRFSQARPSSSTPSSVEELAKNGQVADVRMPKPSNHGAVRGLWWGCDDRKQILAVEAEPAGLGWSLTTCRATRGGKVTDFTPGKVGDSDPRALDSVLRSSFGWRGQQLRLVPNAIAAPSDVDLTRLAVDGTGVATLLKDLAADEPDIFAALLEDLRQVVPQVSRIRFGKDRQENEHGQSESRVTLSLELRSGPRVDLMDVSDGTKSVICLLTAIYSAEQPPLILFDDIDHGIHLSAQYEVIAAVRRVMARRPELQVIGTTHSPVLLDSFDKKEVRVMALGPDGLARIQPLSAHPPVDGYRAGFSSGELWANLGEDWVANG